VPLLLHPSARRALVVGWGSGATAASAALYPIESLECVEIEPATWEAAPFFTELSGRLKDDPRFRIAFRDARNHLLRSPGGYDAIVSEPSNAWISGVSNLFTREFHEAALSRLAPGGLFAQWFHYYSLDPADVKVEVATFLSVFPHVSLWLAPRRAGGRGEEPRADSSWSGAARASSIGRGSSGPSPIPASGGTCGRRASSPTRPPSSPPGPWAGPRSIAGSRTGGPFPTERP
jgi:hypothetical protein